MERRRSSASWPDGGQRVERVAVAVQTGQFHPAEANTSRYSARWDERRADPHGSAGRMNPPVDLHRGQAVGLEHVQGFRERTVVQAGGVGTELHVSSFPRGGARADSLTGAPTAPGRSSRPRSRQSPRLRAVACCAGHGRESVPVVTVQAGDLLKERPCLEHEQVVCPWPTLGKSMGRPCVIRVGRPTRMPVAVDRRRGSRRRS